MRPAAFPGTLPVIYLAIACFACIFIDELYWLISSIMRLLVVVTALFLSMVVAAQHPLAFATKAELAAVKTAIPKYPILQKSFLEIKADVDSWLGKDVDVPFPKDPAGGYTHDKHKANYTLMFNSGLLYNLTGDVRYAALAKGIFLKYAVLNPTLKNHPQATSSSPGRIFWQALNVPIG
ncbi:MAG: hypothetical protein EOO10_03420 [Chitinophagaceae bacterium]|nr:MAG: hypothetical protein EOO10_03420 [Chitinophagaceae bacterium]